MTFIPQRTQHTIYARLPQLKYKDELFQLHDPKFHIGEVVYVKDSDTNPENWKEKIVLGVFIQWMPSIDPVTKEEYFYTPPTWSYYLNDELDTRKIFTETYDCYCEEHLINVHNYYKLIDSYPEKSFLE